ncbi:MAG: acyl-CoA dehydrogenase family protein [Ignavibacteriales bacterium]|nr:MAG: acyl-CoA dehydrogenase family protein [Ignavibacteriales bacterium]
MISLLTEDQRLRYIEFQEFIKINVELSASKWDQDEEMPDDFISLLASTGYLGSNIPVEYGGKGWDFVTFGLLNEAVGKGISSLTDLLTIQAMVSMTLLKWGTQAQKSRWLEPLAKGNIIGAFSLTEPNVGSAIQSLETTINKRGDKYVLNGFKRWTSYGEKADLFLVFGKDEDKSVACLLTKDTPGLTIHPIKNMMGFRAAHMAQLNFNNVEIPETDIVGKPGFALSHVASIGLHYGRISTSCSALGLLRACFEESVVYASQRKIGSKNVGDEGMIRTLIARMGTDLQAASLLCYSACRAEDEKTPDVYEKVQMAKYFTSRAAVKAASDAVQIQGANGCHISSPVSRYYRDSKIMEIIEGTTQIHERMLGKTFVEKAAKILKAKKRT